MTTNVMIDLETFGTGLNAAILAIGAVKFDSSGVFDKIYIPVDPASCQRFGMAIEADAIADLLDAPARKDRVTLSIRSGLDLQSALNGLSNWYGDDSRPTYGDQLLKLGLAYDRIDAPAPWETFGALSYRSLARLDPENELLPDVFEAAADELAAGHARHLIEIAKMFAIPLI